MTVAEVLTDCFNRVHQELRAVLDGIDPPALTMRLDAQANTVAWLAWHVARVQDDHLASTAGTEQVWMSLGFFERFGLPFAPEAHGYGQGPSDVAAVVVGAELLLEYLDAVHHATSAYVNTLADADLGRVVDDSYDPAVTLGVRLVSVVSDNLQHVGQAAYLRGLAERRSLR
ncbi:MAG TPA: DUF664 domain-containing protein [Acidimicrobiales bacterium]|nr:DUF664 domain-containing protein [Acidimicrobiales bacterium]